MRSLTVISVFQLLLFVKSAMAVEISCSIVHELPIGSHRRTFMSVQDSPHENVCIILSARITSINTVMTFPKHRSVELFYLSVMYVGPELFHQLDASTVNLELRKGTLHELVYGLSNLENLKISDTGLARFEVLPEPDSALQTLVINERHMTEVPANVGFLNGLKMLDLSGCSLMTVDLTLFSGLSLLSVMHLADNQLSSVEVSPEVDLPAITMFDVQQNQLSRIDRFPDMFPALKFTQIMQNRWDCEWVSDARRSIWARKIIVLGTDFDCANRIKNGGLCCSYSSPTRARLALAKTILSELDQLSPPVEQNGHSDGQSMKPLITFKVFENETINGVTGAETQNVGIYLQDPLGAV